MRFGVKLFIAYFAILGLAAYLFVNSLISEFKPGLRQSMELAMVDTANIMAELVSRSLTEEGFDQGELEAVMNQALKRRFKADIWTHQKERVDMRVYLTDAQGRVLYDSSGLDVGADYSRWRDVFYSLQGKYGARSTLEKPSDQNSTVMYVAAPVYGKQSSPGEPLPIVGSLSVGVPAVSMQPFIQIAESNVRAKGILLLLVAATLGALMSTWLSLSVRRLMEYARKVQEGERVQPPKLNDPEFTALAGAMEDMRLALEGKEYVENYVLNLTHEMKSPLTTLQGAAELLGMARDEDTRARLSGNIERETWRLKRLVDQVLALARLEKQSVLENRQELDLCQVIQTEIQSQQLNLEARSLRIEQHLPEHCLLEGDAFLLGQAFKNVLENAIDFSSAEGLISVSLACDHATCKLTVRDRGQGIPEYAVERIWERFYSLPRPESGQKSTGLGLSFVREIVDLHSGELTLDNHPESGVIVCITLATH